jgi:putative transcriptional regulator
MTTTIHHPTPELLTDFTAGNLQLSHALCVSTHLEYCSDCQTNVQRLNTMAAQMMSELKPVTISSALKQNVLELLDDELPSKEPDNKPFNRDIPRCLHQFIPDSYDTLPWTRVSPGIKSLKLCVDTNGEKVELVHIKAGKRIPHHTHTGNEYTMLLEGSFSDKNGIYKKGDLIVRDGRHRHQPIATKDKDCICLTVTDSPIQFTGFFTRLLNPLIRRSFLTR